MSLEHNPHSPFTDDAGDFIAAESAQHPRIVGSVEPGESRRTMLAPSFAVSSSPQDETESMYVQFAVCPIRRRGETETLRPTSRLRQPSHPASAGRKHTDRDAIRGPPRRRAKVAVRGSVARAMRHIVLLVDMILR